jgi:hypothetical protein
MDVIVIIFMAIAIIFALASLGYVVVDVVLELRKKEEPIPEPIPEPEPEPEPLPEFVESEPVEIPEDLPEPESVETGIEVIDVAWPESMAKNKIYKYDPNGEILNRGDTVLVPTFDKHRHGEILRMATVINGNYRVESLPEGRVLKKVERVIR